MPLAIGDVGSIIDVDIVELDSDGEEQSTSFDTGTDSVAFAFKFANGDVLIQSGTLVTGSKARYTTVSGDLAAGREGRCEIQLQITSNSLSWTGSSETFTVIIGKKIVSA